MILLQELPGQRHVPEVHVHGQLPLALAPDVRQVILQTVLGFGVRHAVGVRGVWLAVGIRGLVVVVASFSLVLGKISDENTDRKRAMIEK